MGYGHAVRRGGAYNRLAEPSWVDPLDTSYSRKRGGRWNPAGTFGVLYLNRGLRTARLQVQHRLRGHPYGVEDLEETEQHDLVEVGVRESEWLDCITDQGLEAVGLPATYPRDANGQAVPQDRCEPIGQEALDGGRPGIACRSAVGTSAADEELGVFDRWTAVCVRMTARRPFAEWFWSLASDSAS